MHLLCSIFPAIKKRKINPIQLQSCSYTNSPAAPENMMVVSRLAVLFTPEVALQQVKVAILTWLGGINSVHNCTIGLTGVYSCGN